MEQGTSKDVTEEAASLIIADPSGLNESNGREVTTTNTIRDDEKAPLASLSQSQPPQPTGTGNNNTDTSATASTNHAKSDRDEDARFVCNICLDAVKDAVVTVCGHLYCWPCLYRWLNIGHTTCPVCKAGVTKENVIPLFLQGSSQEDPRLKQSSSVPSRPAAQRPAPQPSANGGHPGVHFGGAMGGGMAFSAGLGFFPSLFGLQFQNFAPPPPVPSGAPNRALTPEEIQQNFVSQSLLMLGIFVLFCLLLV